MTLPKMRYFFGHPQLFDCSGWWVVSLAIFKAGRDFGQLCYCRTPFFVRNSTFFVYVFGGYPELGGEFRSFFKVRFAVTRKHRLRHPTSKPSSFFGSFIQCSHCGMQACGNNVGPMQLECWPCVVRVQAPCNQNASTQLGCRLQCAQLECRPSATRMHVPSSAIVQALCIGPAITKAKIQHFAAQQPAITVTRPANAAYCRTGLVTTCDYENLGTA